MPQPFQQLDYATEVNRHLRVLIQGAERAVDQDDTGAWMFAVQEIWRAVDPELERNARLLTSIVGMPSIEGCLDEGVTPTIQVLIDETQTYAQNMIRIIEATIDDGLSVLGEMMGLD